jgi:hypothetical protein
MKSSSWFALFACAVIIKENKAGLIKQTMNQTDENSFVASAIGEIIDKFYAKKDNRVDLLCYPCRTAESADLLNEILKINQKQVTFCVIKPRENIQINNSTIMIFDTNEDHNMFVKTLSFDLFSTRENFYIIYYPLSSGVVSTFQMSENIKSKNFNYVYNYNEKNLNLLTYTLFNEKNCNSFTSERINFFNKTLKMWKDNNTFFTNKFKNFNGCPLSYGKTSSVNSGDAAPTKGAKFGGALHEINEAITKHLNIKNIYVDCPINKITKRRVCDVPFPVIPMLDMFLEVWHIPDYFHPDHIQLVSFNFDYYAGFVIPPGKNKKKSFYEDH